MPIFNFYYNVGHYRRSIHPSSSLFPTLQHSKYHKKNLSKNYVVEEYDQWKADIATTVRVQYMKTYVSCRP